MDDSTILVKTTLGREEIKNRSLKLAPQLRALLIAIDGIKSVSTLAREYPVPKGIAPLIRELMDHGLIEAGTLGARGADAPEPNVDAAPQSFERFRRATQFLNESTSLLGMTGFFFSLKIQRCSNLADLRALAPEFRSAVAKRRSDREAEELMRRFHDLVG